MSEVTTDLRPSPLYKPVSLFVTCIVDMIYPQTGVSVVETLEHLGIEVRFPLNQTCCGQPAFNSGFQDDARGVAKQFLTAFADAEVIVSPSGSCTSMVRHSTPTCSRMIPTARARPPGGGHHLGVHRVSGRWLGHHRHRRAASADEGRPPSRLSRLPDAGPRNAVETLADAVDGVTVTDLKGDDECCGFGGLFAIKMRRSAGRCFRTS